jgi:hypothetical protein
MWQLAGDMLALLAAKHAVRCTTIGGNAPTQQRKNDGQVHSCQNVDLDLLTLPQAIAPDDGFHTLIMGITPHLRVMGVTD